MAKTRREFRAANYAQTQNDAPYRFWGQEEDRKILDPDRPTDRELSKTLHRSVQAIQLRRSRLGGAPTRQEAS